MLVFGSIKRNLFLNSVSGNECAYQSRIRAKLNLAAAKSKKMVEGHEKLARKFCFSNLETPERRQRRLFRILLKAE